MIMPKLIESIAWLILYSLLNMGWIYLILRFEVAMDSYQRQRDSEFNKRFASLKRWGSGIAIILFVLFHVSVILYGIINVIERFF